MELNSEVKASACNAGDLGSVPGLGRSPGEGNGNPLQDSCLENPMDRGAWWTTVHGVAESDTTEQLHYHSLGTELRLLRCGGGVTWNVRRAEFMAKIRGHHYHCSLCRWRNQETLNFLCALAFPGQGHFPSMAAISSFHTLFFCIVTNRSNAWTPEELHGTRILLLQFICVNRLKNKSRLF